MVGARALIVLMLLVPAAFAQQAKDSTPPCSTPEFSQFDFWVGEWQLQWGDSSTGTNSITKPLGSCVVMEHFAASDSAGLRGISVSTFNRRLKKWQQTWVDNQGGYLDFVGEFKDGQMVLSREATRPDGKHIVQRMIWHDITPDSLIWDWQASEDNGATWKTNWQIKYRRQK